MKSISFFFLFLVGISASAQIQFEKPEWSQAFEKARKEKKLLMVYANTEWCEPCLDMELSVFQDPSVGDFYNKSFVSVPFDMEGFPGIELADQYRIDVYPTFLFLNASGEVVHRGCGLMENEGFLLMGKDALGGSNLLALRKKFESGDRSVALITSYTELLESACMDKSTFIKSYFKDLSKDQWLTEATWTMLNLNIEDPTSREFEFLTIYRDRYAMIAGTDTVDAKIYQVLLNQFIDIYEGADLTYFSLQTLRKMIAPLNFSGKDRLRYMVDLEYSELVEDWELYAYSVQKVVEDQQLEDTALLNEFAWKFYLHISNPDDLANAIDWMVKVNRQQPSASSLDTYASLLYKTGNKKEAIKQEKLAMDAAKKNYEDLLHYQLQLDKFEKDL